MNSETQKNQEKDWEHALMAKFQQGQELSLKDVLAIKILEGKIGWWDTLKVNITESDWRGIIALILVCGFLLLLGITETEADMKTVSSILSGPVGLVIGYYFGHTK